MYKVLFIGDDAIRKTTTACMPDQSSYDWQMIHVAMDMQNVCEQLRKDRFDMIIMEYDGKGGKSLPLIEEIKKRNHQIPIIIVSDFDDFDSVKTALKAGAFDFLRHRFLTKETLSASMIQALKNAQTSSTVEENAFERLQQCLILVKNRHVVEPSEFQSVLGLSAFDIYRTGMRLAYFRIDNIHLLYRLYDLNHSNIHHTLKKMIRDMLLETSHHSIFISNHSGVILFHQEEEQHIHALCQKILYHVHHVMGMHVSITLSAVLPSLSQFHSCFCHLLNIHDMRFYIGEGVFMQADEREAFHRLDYQNIRFHLQMIDQVEQRIFSHLSALIEETLVYMKDHRIHPDDVRNYFVFIFNNIEGNAIIKGMQKAFHFDLIHAQLQECETMERLKEIAEKAFQQLHEWMLDASQNRYRKDIMEIITYVEEHYTKKVSLHMIASHFNINESYLSRIFKMETGKTLIYFINERKMKKARELLCDPDIMIKEAAYQVGIEDQFYFNKVFRKFYGISPSAYRKKMRSELEKA